MNAVELLSEPIRNYRRHKMANGVEVVRIIDRSEKRRTRRHWSTRAFSHLDCVRESGLPVSRKPCYHYVAWDQ